MKKGLQIFTLELRRLARTGVVAMLGVAAVAWMFAMPYLVKSDGTTSGAMEMYVHYSLGGVFALLMVALSASGAGTLAVEREEKRLQLTLTRPVRYATVALSRTAALTFVGAVVLGIASMTLWLKVDMGPCYHVHSPRMESPKSEAARLYDDVIKDPNTPAEVKKAPKDAVLRILEQKAWDNYLTIPRARSAAWLMGDVETEGKNLAVRLRFTNNFDTRETVKGVFKYGGYAGTISNITQAVIVTPLVKDAENVLDGSSQGTLVFNNEGENTLMLRPRRDIKLLVEGDSFGMNIIRAWLEMTAMLTLVIAFAVFLSSCLGRTVAIFTTMTMLAVMEMSPSVIEQYPDALETDRRDRISLMLTRAVEKVTRPVASLNPLESLAAGDMLEAEEVTRAVLEDMIVLPLLLALLSGLGMSVKKV